MSEPRKRTWTKSLAVESEKHPDPMWLVTDGEIPFQIDVATFNEADANLIAAAPDLLGAAMGALRFLAILDRLKHVTGALESSERLVYDQLVKAIEKAEGVP